MAWVSSLCLTALILLHGLHAAQAACTTPGKFGRDCHLDCNCQGFCNSDTGTCSGSCASGFFGPSCQKQNVAMRKGAWGTSSFTNQWTPEKAVDGFTNQNADMNSCYHSDILMSSAFFIVELCQPVHMSDIVIYWRTNRLYRGQNVKIYVANTTGAEQLCHTIGSSNNYPSSVVNLNCLTYAQRLVLRHVSPCGECLLEICEVQVFDCTPGTYGSDCSYQCGHCQDIACNRVLGSCPRGCQPGWRGFKCDVECAEGTYGQDCSGQCGQCSDGAKCDHVTGSCLSGSCQPGYTGDRCDRIDSGSTTVAGSTAQDQSNLLKGVGIGAGAVLGVVVLVGVVVLGVKRMPKSRAQSSRVSPGPGAWGANSASFVHPRYVDPRMVNSDMPFEDEKF